jgi:hypothetical protein
MISETAEISTGSYTRERYVKLTCVKGDDTSGTPESEDDPGLYFISNQSGEERDGDLPGQHSGTQRGKTAS